MLHKPLTTERRQQIRAAIADCRNDPTWLADLLLMAFDEIDRLREIIHDDSAHHHINMRYPDEPTATEPK